MSSPGQSVPPENISQSIWWMLKFPNTKTEDGLIGRTSSMLDEVELKSMVNDKEGDR